MKKQKSKKGWVKPEVKILIIEYAADAGGDGISRGFSGPT
jgi:hypothetical protein